MPVQMSRAHVATLVSAPDQRCLDMAAIARARSVLPPAEVAILATGHAVDFHFTATEDPFSCRYSSPPSKMFPIQGLTMPVMTLANFSLLPSSPFFAEPRPVPRWPPSAGQKNVFSGRS